MSKPQIDSLLDSIKPLLSSFDPTTLAYLDPAGKWKTDPAMTRDRISNELWFRIWQAESEGDCSEVVSGLLRPFLRDETSWDVTEKFFSGKLAVRGWQIGELLIVAETLYGLIEYDCCRTNEASYVADWDSKGKVRRAVFADRAESFLGNLRKGTDSPSQVETVLRILDELKKDGASLFSRVASVITEEERLRQSLSEMLDRSKDSGLEAKAQVPADEQVPVTLSGMTAQSEALLRPCLELLAGRDIDISSGIQYEASEILGRLKDIRATGTLLAAIADCDPRHTYLRSNLIYAVGSLGQKKALGRLVEILKGPPWVEILSPDGASSYKQPLDPEKCEAVWALGKLADDAAGAVPTLIHCSDSRDTETRVYLAWAMGKIGSGQKRKRGGVDAGVLITLMRLLTAGENSTFEEAAFALRQLGLPEFLYTLYLHDFSTMPILSLKPSSTGLYELSETILHLASMKRPVVMAVTGDSGTGKTYFCQTITSGFGGIRADEVLYLMRDTPQNTIFDRMLGIEWLKQHVDPRFYENYPLREDEDDPDEYFDRFMDKHAGKRLIILDGWRDEVYFDRVIRTFYEKGYLDILVRFQTTFSTRRINLEERDNSLESVKAHLPLIEEPAIENTRVYREGAVLIYNLDNSIPSRMNGPEILEVFDRKKVDAWGDQIRIGSFGGDALPLEIRSQTLSYDGKDVSLEDEPISADPATGFTPSETRFSRVINDDLDRYPNLLQVVRAGDIAIRRIGFYTHGQIACCGYDGSIAVLIGLNDRIFRTDAHEGPVSGIAVVGRDIYSIDDTGNLMAVSFHHNTRTKLATADSPAGVIAAYRYTRLLTGHSDGTVRLWHPEGKRVTVLRLHDRAVTALAADRRGRIYSGSDDGKLYVWHPEEKGVRSFEMPGASIGAIGTYPDGRVVLGVAQGDRSRKGDSNKGVQVGLLDCDTGSCEAFRIPDAESINSINAYFDGRLILGIKRAAGMAQEASVIICDPRPDSRCHRALRAHGLETQDCITMGPRIVTCGSDSQADHTIRILGTSSYVRVEAGKSALLAEATVKPPYYHSLF